MVQCSKGRLKKSFVRIVQDGGIFLGVYDETKLSFVFVQHGRHSGKLPFGDKKSVKKKT